MSLLVISFDAIGDKVFESMASDPKKYPAIASFYKKLTYQNNVKTIFVSNTYPIHTSISTGKYPYQHGITSNILPAPNNNYRGPEKWAMEEKLIKTKTIWQAATEKKLKTAAFLWPVTCGAKINWHMPEVHLLKGQKRIREQLRHGSKMFQIQSMLENKNLLNNITDIESSQPQLDNFTTAVASSLFKKKQPDLALVHLIAYDHICHQTGPEPTQANDIDKLEIAKKAMNDNLELLLDSWKGDVLIFSDHSQLQVNENINLNTLYRNENFLQLGGCAFGVRFDISLPEQYWFGRYLTKEEIHESGYSGKYTFGIAAKPGFNFGVKPFHGDHGYPTDYDNYSTFYGINKKINYTNHLKKNVLDVTAIIAKELNLDMDIIKEYGM